MASVKFFYPLARLPDTGSLTHEIDLAAGRLCRKFSDPELRRIPISDYSKRYLRDKLRDLTSNLQLYSYVLAWALVGLPANPSRSVFMDYGGGLGMLSLLAKELGVGTVIYNDVYAVSCQDARVIGTFLGDESDYYIAGDIDSAIDFMSSNDIGCDAVASYDVIEHIYDLDHFFSKLPRLSDGPLSVTMASGANSLNPVIRIRTMATQTQVEFRNREEGWGHKQRDNLKAYRTLREEIIQAHLRQLGVDLAIDELARLTSTTRGLIAGDIRKSVDRFLLTGELPTPPSPSTNTCDPMTGNWAERLMEPKELAKSLSLHGFSVQILSGYFGTSTRPGRRILGSMANVAVRGLPFGQGIRLAPFYMIRGVRTRTD